MEGLSEHQISQFLHRSYGSVDGLWFMKVEEKYGFDAALEIDREVWKVLPKIQARMLKSMLKLENGMDGLAKSLEARFGMDGFVYELEKLPNNVLKITISHCPWHQLMEKSGRAKLSGKVGDVVCVADYTAWSKEFGNEIDFYTSCQICKGAESCVMIFSLPQPL
ncbi:MAG: DUF6125 family protein [Dehalococcoidales bacterium]|jgi:predicted ArsR family transcriptional regulator|nr:DUF6125 family protein [Dehalococcoidales bacterium]MDD4229891.1 DUF6125 family protein [Dehalococcoidales bacterium]MDD4465576.1 DUF6125 family protein [Dehalococcoidales bacterium]MDD5402032.1 DUF6125 family protein [Dehalococcoidales bacterium]